MDALLLNKNVCKLYSWNKRPVTVDPSAQTVKNDHQQSCGWAYLAVRNPVLMTLQSARRRCTAGRCLVSATCRDISVRLTTAALQISSTIHI